MTARRAALAKAIERLSEALSATETPLQRDAAIQRFEFSFELAWKSIQERARDEGLECVSPKACFQLAFRAGWIDAEEAWLAMVKDRNETAHTYNEVLAKDVYSRLDRHLVELRKLSEALGA